MKTICYDIISLASKKPELKRCPHCESVLSIEPVQASRDAAAFVQQAEQPEVSTRLALCEQCGWWAVRERRDDHGLYHPPVADLIVLEVAGQQAVKPGRKKNRVAKSGKTAPWQVVLDDVAYWQDPVTIPSADALHLFGSAQMLLPKLAAPTGRAVWTRLKSMAPILIPLLVIALIVLSNRFS